MKDSYSTVRLPDDLYFSARQQGINNKSKDAANILSRVAKYTKATLKVIGQLSQNHSEDTEIQDSVNDLMICMVSQMRFLQERHASLVVAGTYGVCAKRLFDSIGGTTTSFAHPQILQRVETAAKLASYQPREETSSFSDRPFRGRGHGAWRGRGSFRGPFRGQGSDFQQFPATQFPQDRECDDN